MNVIDICGYYRIRQALDSAWLIVVARESNIMNETIFIE